MKKPIALFASLILAASPWLLPVATARADSSLAYTEFPTQVGASPNTIASGPGGDLYFTDNIGGIDRMNTSGVVTGQYPVGASVSDMTTGPDGNLWFVGSAVGAAQTGVIGNITASGNVTEYPFPSGATPNGITAGPDGALWFTEDGINSDGHNDIGRITTSGAITEYPVTSGNSPSFITAGPDGNLWYGEETSDGTGSIGNMTTSGSVTDYSIPSGEFPDSITTGPDGNLWFAENNSSGTGSAIGKITTSGAVSEYPLSSGVVNGNSITVGPDGNLWFADVTPGTTLNGAIGEITTSGAITEHPVAPGSDPTGVVTGSDGNLWFSDANGGVGRMTLPSTLVSAISAGGPAAGNYSADTDYSGGSTYSTSASVDTSNVLNPAPQSVYQNCRYGGTFSYTFPGLTPGNTYTLRLDFDELYWGTALSDYQGGVGSRVFNVGVNGTPVLSNFDIYAAAGGSDKAIAEQFTTTADSSGNVTVSFTSDTDNAEVNGLALYAGTLPPQPTVPDQSDVYIAAGSGSSIGSFPADNDYNGGTPYSSDAMVDTSQVTNPAPSSVYQNVRYGNFTYTVPHLVPNTNYNVRLDFNELYWGTVLSGYQGGTGSRVFNVSINGSQVLSNFDIYATAGGANKAIAENFTANSGASGIVTIQFTSVVDNAAVSGIEVTQE